MAERIVELKFVVAGKSEYAADIAAINKITESTDDKAAQASANIAKSFQDAGQKVKGSFQLDQIDKSLKGVEATAKKLEVEIVSVFENAGAEIKGTVVNLTEQKKALEASAAAAIKTGQALSKISPNVGKPSSFNVNSQLVPAAQTGKAVQEVKKLEAGFKSAKTELRELTNLLSSGQLSGEELQIAINRAGQLRDNISDTNQLVASVGRDTRGLDAVVQAAQGVAAGFSVAAGGIALFSDDAEQAAIVTQKVQGALALLTGVQELARLATDKNALAIGGLTIAQRANNISTIAATGVMRIFGVSANVTATSFKVLKGAIIATGIGALLVGLGVLISYLSEAGTKTDDFAGSITDAAQEARTAVEKLAEAQLNLQQVQGKITDVEAKKQARVAEFEKTMQDQKIKNLETIAELERLKAEETAVSFSNIIDGRAEVEERALRKMQARLAPINKEIKTKLAAEKAALEADLLAIETEAGKKSIQARVDLSKQLLNAQLAAERARIQLVLAVTKEGSELQKEATIALNEFELQATLKLLEQEKKERRKALKESGVATKADFDALNAEILQRGLLAKQQTDTESRKIDNDYRSQRLLDEREFQAKLRQIEVDRINAIQDLATASDEIIRRRKANNAINNTADGTKARLDAENAAIKSAADAEIKILDEKREKILSKETELTEQEAALEYNLGQQRIEISEDAERQISENTASFLGQQTSFYIDAFQNLSNSILEIQSNLLDRRIQSIQEASDFELKNSNLTAAQKLRLEKKTADEIAKIRAVQAKNEKTAAIFSIFLNTAKAVVESLATPPPFNIALAAIVAGLGAAQAAAVASRPDPKFAEGGEVKGPSHLKGGVKIEAEGGEYIINKKMYSANPKAAEALNKSRKAFEDFVFNTYIKPAMYAERMRSGVDSGRSVPTPAERKIELRTGKLEKEVSDSRRDARKNTDRIVDAVVSNNVDPRSRW